MQKSKLQLFISLFTDQNSTKKFLAGVILGFGFSIAVILSTIGIMDGFERSLRQGLKKSTGDITINSRMGFFYFDESLKRSLLDNHITQYSKVVQTESFLIFNDESKGVLVKGIDDYYGGLVGLDLQLQSKEVAIGSEIAHSLQIKVGDEIVLAFAKGNSEFKSLPGLNRFRVAKIVEHGVYQKDSRLIYMPLKDVQDVLELSDKVNLIAANFDLSNVDSSSYDSVFKRKMDQLRSYLGNEFYLRPYWKDFSSLIEAVKVEKTMIALILQLVVIISIFNVLAFIIFINEKKSKELFLFKALGMSQTMMSKLWFRVVLGIWAISCLVSIVFVQVFKVLLKYISIFNLPAEIYFMPRLEMYLTLKQYLVVFIMAFVWILLITFFLLRRMRKKSLLEGLRQEFA